MLKSSFRGLLTSDAEGNRRAHPVLRRAFTYCNVPYRGMQCAIERVSLSGIVPNKEEHSGFIRAFSNSHLQNATSRTASITLVPLIDLRAEIEIHTHRSRELSV